MKFTVEIRDEDVDEARTIIKDSIRMHNVRPLIETPGYKETRALRLRVLEAIKKGLEGR